MTLFSDVEQQGGGVVDEVKEVNASDVARTEQRDANSRRQRAARVRQGAALICEGSALIREWSALIREWSALIREGAALIRQGAALIRMEADLTRRRSGSHLVSATVQSALNCTYWLLRARICTLKFQNCEV